MTLPLRSLRIAIQPTTAQAATLHTIHHDSNDYPVPTCNVELSCGPFMDTETITFIYCKNDVMQGLSLINSQ